jgi:hypothetical protein
MLPVLIPDPYFEYQDMAELGAASPEAIESARRAVQRALGDAEDLAPWAALSGTQDGGSAA